MTPESLCLGTTGLGGSMVAAHPGNRKCRTWSVFARSGPKTGAHTL
jgi:hypothetical protein